MLVVTPATAVHVPEPTRIACTVWRGTNVAERVRVAEPFLGAVDAEHRLAARATRRPNDLSPDNRYLLAGGVACACT